MEETKKPAKPQPEGGGGPKKPQAKILRIGFWLVLALVAVLVIRGIASDDDSTEASGGEAEIVSIDELRDTAAERETPIYWAGLQDGELELSQPQEGQTFVRYLPEGTEAGGDAGGSLTVGTYEFADAAANLERLGKRQTAVLATAPGEGVVYFDQQRPQNVYLAFPDQDIQIEVFDPDPKRAIELVSSGQIVPIG